MNRGDEKTLRKASKCPAAFFGRPPRFPFSRAERAFRSEVTDPPALSISDTGEQDSVTCLHPSRMRTSTGGRPGEA